MTAYSITPEGATEAAKEIVDSEWTCCHANPATVTELAAIILRHAEQSQPDDNEFDLFMATFNCPCCNWPDCGHDHHANVKEFMLEKLRKLKAGEV